MVQIHSNEGVSCDFFGDFILKLPNSFLLGKFFLQGPDLGQQSDFEASHREKKVGVVLRVHRYIGIFPVNGRDTSWKPILDLPKDTSPQVYIVLHQSHSAVLGPALSVVVAHDVLVVGVRVFCQEPLDQFSGLVVGELEEDVEMVDVPQVDSDGMPGLDFNRLEDHELVFIHGRTCELIGSVETHDQDIDDETVELENEGGKLKTH
jgi:hypothetical protein